MLDQSNSEATKIPIVSSSTVNSRKSATGYLVPSLTDLPIIEKTLGRSPLIKCNNLARYLNTERLFVKFEGSNPTGTQKDRIAHAMVRYAKSHGYEAITTASCGNFGVAVAYFGKLMDLEVHVFIPEGYHVAKERLDRIYSYQALIHYVPGTYEDAVEISRFYGQDQGYFDANPGSELNVELSLAAYAVISLEILSSLRRTPDYVICPVGNGTTLAGIYHGFSRLYNEGKINKLPKMIASSTPRGNPIIYSFKKGDHTIQDLDPAHIRETRVNEPLTNWKSFDGQIALDAIYGSHGYAEYANDLEMIKLSKLILREEGISVLPASASALAVIPKLYESSTGLLERNNHQIKGTIVSVLTSRSL